MFLFKFSHEKVDKPIVKILTTQMSITSSSSNFKNSVIDRKQGNIKSSTTEVKDKNILFSILLIQAICNCRCSGFVNDADYIQASNCPGILSCQALCIIKTRWDCNHSVFHL